MKYLLLIYIDEQALSETTREECYMESVQLTHQLKSRGQYLAANPLHPTSTATSVRVRAGTVLVTDGPFAETREQLGGYFLIDVKDHDEAIGVAARIPGARLGTVEIRPVMEVAGPPTDEWLRLADAIRGGPLGPAHMITPGADGLGRDPRLVE